MKIKQFIILAATLILSGPLWAAPFVELKDGSKKYGASIRMDSQKNIVLRTETGNITFTPDQYVRAVADPPASWNKLLSAINSGNFEPTIAPLQKIIAENKGLYWDEAATGLLGQALLGTGDAAGALKAFDSLLLFNPGAAEGDMRFTYWKALLANKKFSSLEPKLDNEIENGKESGAAMAQLIKGDLNTGRNRLEDALLDYLRAYTLYKKEKDVLPEALYKATKTLEGLKDGRAKQFWRLLAERYGATKYGKEAASKI